MAGFFRRGSWPFSFLRGKKLVVFGFGGTISSLGSQPPRWPLGSLSTLSPADPPSGRLPSLLITWEVHCRSGFSSTPPHNLGENDHGRKQLKPGDALKGKCPSLTLFTYLPSIVGIASDSSHQVLSHCYNVPPRLSTHCPRLYPYQSSVLALQDSLARIILHKVEGCDPYTLHIDIPLNPTSNSGRLLHLWHPCPWRWGGLSSCKLLPLSAIYLFWDIMIHMTCQT